MNHRQLVGVCADDDLCVFVRVRVHVRLPVAFLRW